MGVTVLSPLLSGYAVSIATGAHGPTAFFVAGGERVQAPFALHEALAGLIPFLALMTATSGQSLLQWLRRCGVGVAVMYVAHVAVLILSPLLVTPHVWWVNRIIDVTYGFYAVAGFVGLPFSLWMILTRPWVGGALVAGDPAVATSAVEVDGPEPAAPTKPRKRRR